MTRPSIEERIAREAAAVGLLAIENRLRVGVAESLTSGRVAVALGQVDGASTWFAGSMVSYMNETKFRVLGVPEGPVITEQSAISMVQGVLRSGIVDAAAAVTGVGGPGPEEGRPAGSVFIAAGDRDHIEVFEHSLDGGPDEVVAASAALTLTHLREHLERRPSDE